MSALLHAHETQPFAEGTIAVPIRRIESLPVVLDRKMQRVSRSHEAYPDVIGFGMLDDIAGGFLQDSEDCYLDRIGNIAFLDHQMFLDFYAAAGTFKLAKKPRQSSQDAEIVKRRGTQIHGNAAQFTERILNL